jgi:hypothetical protein
MLFVVSVQKPWRDRAGAKGVDKVYLLAAVTILRKIVAKGWTTTTTTAERTDPG